MDIRSFAPGSQKRKTAASPAHFGGKPSPAQVVASDAKRQRTSPAPALTEKKTPTKSRTAPSAASRTVAAEKPHPSTFAKENVKEEKSTKQKSPAKAREIRKSPRAKAKSSPKVDPSLPLGGQAFVFTGLLKEWPDREDAEDDVKKLGGRVTSAVSGKTTYLVAGYVLENGGEVEQSRKYKDAKERGTEIISEESFKAMLEKHRASVAAVAKSAGAQLATA